MKRHNSTARITRTLALLGASLLIASCASGGGGGGSTGGGGTGGGGGGGGPTPFTSWSAVGPNSNVIASGRSRQASYTANVALEKVTSVGTPTATATGASYTQKRDGTSLLTDVTIVSATGTNISFATSSGSTFEEAGDVIEASNASGSNAALVASADSLGWNYQSFGVWITGLDTGSGTVGGMTVGASTAGASVPTTGSATYLGVAGGVYMAPDGTLGPAGSDMSAGANFATRSISFSTTGSNFPEDGATAAPGLDLSGTLTYSAGSASFTGNITSAGGMAGTADGVFYGPAAQELGGVFAVTGAGFEGFIGGFGGER